LFRSAARDQISQSKCPYAKTISKIGEDFEIALIKAVERTVRRMREIRGFQKR
jgi:DNA-binding HxlR family transcriptional regulator